MDAPVVNTTYPCEFAMYASLLGSQTVRIKAGMRFVIVELGSKSSVSICMFS